MHLLCFVNGRQLEFNQLNAKVDDTAELLVHVLRSMPLRQK